MIDELQEIKEIQSLGRIFFINMSTYRDPVIKLARGILGEKIDETELHNSLMVSDIKANQSLESGSFLQIIDPETKIYLPRVTDIKALVITGSPFLVPLLVREKTKFGIEKSEKGAFLPFWQRDMIDFIKEVYGSNIPILGVCYGAEIIAEALGGKVERMRRFVGGEWIKIAERGWSWVRNKKPEDPLMKGLPSRYLVSENHKYEITKLPPGGVVLADNEYGVQVFRVGNAWGITYHPEKTFQDTDKLFSKEKVLEQMLRQGLDPKEVQELGNLYSPELMNQQLSNFLKIASVNFQ